MISQMREEQGGHQGLGNEPVLEGLGEVQGTETCQHRRLWGICSTGTDFTGTPTPRYFNKCNTRRGKALPPSCELTARGTPSSVPQLPALASPSSRPPRPQGREQPGPYGALRAGRPGLRQRRDGRAWAGPGSLPLRVHLSPQDAPQSPEPPFPPSRSLHSPQPLRTPDPPQSPEPPVLPSRSPHAPEPLRLPSAFRIPQFLPAGPRTHPSPSGSPQAPAPRPRLRPQRCAQPQRPRAPV